MMDADDRWPRMIGVECDDEDDDDAVGNCVTGTMLRFGTMQDLRHDALAVHYVHGTVCYADIDGDSNRCDCMRLRLVSDKSIVKMVDYGISNLWCQTVLMSLYCSLADGSICLDATKNSWPSVN